MSTQETAGPGTTDRTAISVITIIGIFLGGFTAGQGIIAGIFRLVNPASTPIELIADIPVDSEPGVEATATSLSVTADTLSAGTLWMLAAADIIGGLAIALTVASSSYLLLGIVRRRPFTRASFTAMVVAGCSILFGSLLAQAIGGFGTMMAADELNSALGGVAYPGFEFSALPILVGLVILAFAYVFRIGSRLQDDSDGLV